MRWAGKERKDSVRTECTSLAVLAWIHQQCCKIAAVIGVTLFLAVKFVVCIVLFSFRFCGIMDK